MNRRVLLQGSAAAAAGALTSTVSGKESPRILIVFFSRAGENYAPGKYEMLEVGHTERMARMIAERTGAELLKVEPMHAYPAGYRETTEVAQAEKTAQARPPVATPQPDWARCDVVFIGHPIWWGEMPMPMRTFLDGAQLSGKTLIHFATHEGSGFGESEATFRHYAAGARTLEGLALGGRSVAESRPRIEAWLDRIGF